MTERFAIFYAPETDSALWQRAALWLGRDATGAALGAASVPAITPARRAEVTVSARRYGFHATMKPPFALAPGRNRLELETALSNFAATHDTAVIGTLAVRALGGFLALMPEHQTAALSALAGACVTAFEQFRAPLSAEDRARRQPDGLSAHQRDLLERYGYPYVLDQFQFHMTIADQIGGHADADAIRTAARDWFAPALRDPVMLDRLVLFHEAEPGAPFMRIAEFPLRPTQAGAQ